MENLLRRRRRRSGIQKETSSHKTYQFISDHCGGRRVRKYRVRHICYEALQTSTLKNTETACKPIASLDQSDLEFLVPADHDTYIDMNIQLYISGKLTKANGTELEVTDYTCVTNDVFHSLLGQCNITLNGVTRTLDADLYHYRAYFETLLNYGSDAVTSNLTMMI